MVESSTFWSTDVASNRPIIDSVPEIPPQTFISAFRDIVRERPDNVQYILPDQTEVTVKQFYDLCVRVAKALIALGLEPLQAVCIHGASAVEWCAADFAAGLAAGISAGAYVLSGAEVVAHMVNTSEARVFFTDGEEGLDKFLSVKHKCPSVHTVVTWGAFDSQKYAGHGEFITGWDRFLVLGDAVPDARLAERAALPRPTSVCKLIFTSGTTGLPKAGMLTHDNFVYTARIVAMWIQPTSDDRMVSFLPISHITPEVVNILYSATFVMFDSDTRNGSFIAALQKSRPTIVLGTPRVFEKIKEHMLTMFETGGEGAAATEVSNAEILDLKRSIGIDRCRLLITVGAPLQQATADYLSKFDIPIVNNYGMTEATGPLTNNYPDQRAGTVGKAMHGVEVHIEDAGNGADGELCFRSRNVFVGYKDNEPETRAKFNDIGFMRSGDLGRMDEDGFVIISGRAKELLVLNSGRNVAPLLVEATLVSAMPAIARAFAIGDGKEYISAVLIPYMDTDGLLIGPAAAVNPAISSAKEALTDDIWTKYLNEGVVNANERAGSEDAVVKQFEMLDRDFSLAMGELTPTMKVKRSVITENLAPMVARLYK